MQKIFRTIRSVLNDNEDKLLSEFEDEFYKLYSNERLIKEREKLPKK